MYCANCGTPLTQGLSYCNRCGANLRERTDTKTPVITAFLASIVIIAVVGLGILLGGALALRENGFVHQMIGFFMLFTFLIVGMIEFMLVRNLSRLTSSTEPKYLPAPQVAPHDMRLPHATPFGEPVPSVTETTTRTLEYARREQ